MRQLMYAMQFKGSAAPVTESPLVLKAATSAPSGRLTSTVGSGGLETVLESVPGGQAAFESEVTFTGEGAFQERGTIGFGDGHRLRFSTVGEGYLGPSADPALKHGAVSWRVDGGEGQFAGARGLITSNFFVGEAGEVTDNQFGVVFVE